MVGLPTPRFWTVGALLVTTLKSSALVAWML